MADVRRPTRTRASSAVSTSTATGQSLTPGDCVGDYEIVEELGRGGMGTVYAARHPVIGKEVAIKVVNRDFACSAEVRARFVVEAQSLTRIRHDHVVDVYSFGELADGRSFLVMELLRGDSLCDLLVSDSLSALEAIEILGQVSAALRACHEAGVIHRDVKPDNVIVVDRGGALQIKLIDFGIAKFECLPLREGLTGEGTILGTPAYMSPEQIRGGEVDERCDLYGFGVLAYEMFGKAVPFQGPTPVDTLTQVLSKQPAPLSELRRDCPAGVEALVGDLLAKSPDARPTTSELEARLLSIRETLESPVEPALAVAKPWWDATRQAIPIALLGIGLVIAAAAIQRTSVTTIQRPPSPPSSTAPRAAPDSTAPEPALEVVGEIASTDGDDLRSINAIEPKRARRRRPRRSRLALENPDGLLDPFPGGLK